MENKGGYDGNGNNNVLVAVHDLQGNQRIRPDSLNQPPCITSWNRTISSSSYWNPNSPDISCSLPSNLTSAFISDSTQPDLLSTLAALESITPDDLRVSKQSRTTPAFRGSGPFRGTGSNPFRGSHNTNNTDPYLVQKPPSCSLTNSPSTQSNAAFPSGLTPNNSQHMPASTADTTSSAPPHNITATSATAATSPTTTTAAAFNRWPRNIALSTSALGPLKTDNTTLLVPSGPLTSRTHRTNLSQLSPAHVSTTSHVTSQSPSPPSALPGSSNAGSPVEFGPVPLGLEACVGTSSRPRLESRLENYGQESCVPNCVVDLPTRNDEGLLAAKGARNGDGGGDGVGQRHGEVDIGDSHCHRQRRRSDSDPAHSVATSDAALGSSDPWASREAGTVAAYAIAHSHSPAVAANVHWNEMHGGVRQVPAAALAAMSMDDLSSKDSRIPLSCGRLQALSEQQQQQHGTTQQQRHHDHCRQQQQQQKQDEGQEQQTQKDQHQEQQHLGLRCGHHPHPHPQNPTASNTTPPSCPSPSPAPRRHSAISCKYPLLPMPPLDYLRPYNTCRSSGSSSTKSVGTEREGAGAAANLTGPFAGSSGGGDYGGGGADVEQTGSGGGGSGSGSLMLPTLTGCGLFASHMRMRTSVAGAHGGEEAGGEWEGTPGGGSARREGDMLAHTNSLSLGAAAAAARSGFVRMQQDALLAGAAAVGARVPQASPPLGCAASAANQALSLTAAAAATATTLTSPAVVAKPAVPSSQRYDHTSGVHLGGVDLALPPRPPMSPYAATAGADAAPVIRGNNAMANNPLQPFARASSPSTLQSTGGAQSPDVQPDRGNDSVSANRKYNRTLKSQLSAGSRDGGMFSIASSPVPSSNTSGRLGPRRSPLPSAAAATDTIATAAAGTTMPTAIPGARWRLAASPAGNCDPSGRDRSVARGVGSVWPSGEYGWVDGPRSEGVARYGGGNDGGGGSLPQPPSRLRRADTQLPSGPTQTTESGVVSHGSLPTELTSMLPSPRWGLGLLGGGGGGGSSLGGQSSTGTLSARLRRFAASLAAADWRPTTTDCDLGSFTAASPAGPATPPPPPSVSRPSLPHQCPPPPVASLQFARLSLPILGFGRRSRAPSAAASASSPTTAANNVAVGSPPIHSSARRRASVSSYMTPSAAGAATFTSRPSTPTSGPQPAIIAPTAATPTTAAAAPAASPATSPLPSESTIHEPPALRVISCTLRVSELPRAPSGRGRRVVTAEELSRRLLAEAGGAATKLLLTRAAGGTADLPPPASKSAKSFFPPIAEDDGGGGGSGGGAEGQEGGRMGFRASEACGCVVM